MQPYFFNSRDGRGSEAVLALLADLLERKRDAAQLAVAGFDMSAYASHPEDMGPLVARHWVMANNIAQYAGSYDLVIVNVGNAHPIVLRSRLIGLNGLTSGSAVAVREIYEAGRAWNCSNGRCGSQDFAGSSIFPDSVPETYPYLSLSNDIGAFDGYLSLGPITAAEPVYQSGDCNRVWRRVL
nr:hypothetical protein GCM10011355_22470 [Aquisalinus luteolus]